MNNKIIKKYINSVFATTGIDSRGECLTKEVLVEFSKRMPEKFPIYYNHDPESAPQGYAKNFRVIKDYDKNIWLLVADLYITSENFDEAKTPALSITTTDYVYKEGSEFLLLLPHPHYNNEDLFTELNASPELTVGKIYRKTADPITLAVIMLLVQFPLGTIYKHILEPHLTKLIDYAYKLKNEKKIPSDIYLSIIGKKDEEVKILLRLDHEGDTTLNSEIAYSALELAAKFIESDTKAYNTGIDTLKFTLDKSKTEFTLYEIVYRDGVSQRSITSISDYD
jgi:hypothetical protein